MTLASLVSRMVDHGGVISRNEALARHDTGQTGLRNTVPGERARYKRDRCHGARAYVQERWSGGVGKSDGGFSQLIFTVVK